MNLGSSANSWDVFVSYSREDRAVVWPEVQGLEQIGYRVWLDKFLPAGNEWPAAVQSALEAAKAVLVFVSSSSTSSQHVRNEINRAVSQGKPLVVVHLEDTPLSRGVGLQLGAVQAILRYRLAPAEYEEFLRRALSAATGVNDDLSVASSGLAEARRRFLARARWFGGAACAVLCATASVSVFSGRLARSPLPRYWYMSILMIASVSVLALLHGAIRNAWRAGWIRRRSVPVHLIPYLLSVAVLSGLIVLPYDGSIEGIVVEVEGSTWRPVGGVAIWLRIEGPRAQYRLMTQTDSTGRFRLQGLQAADGADVMLVACAESKSARQFSHVASSETLKLLEKKCPLEP